MIIAEAVTQPTYKSTLNALDKIMESGPVTHIDIAAAYVTSGGARDLLSKMRHRMGGNWPVVSKRWIVAFDYCRSEPTALEMLAAIPNSKVKIHDAVRVIRQNCTPAVPFHPKAFIFRGPNRVAALAGSGNLSRSGLNTGFEAGLCIDIRLPIEVGEDSQSISLTSLQKWFGKAWQDGSPLSAALLGSYTSIYESIPKMKHPTVTEDDVISAVTGRNSLPIEDLLKLRACRNFWIEAGNITKNLGKGKPGNQLMMKRLSRVFFGVPATNVPQNSPLTKIQISFNGAPKPDCSLTFSDNGMDKLTLPVPDAGGPPTYDDEDLLFTRLSAGSFQIQLGTTAKKASWLRRSAAINASFSMSGGRKWGVF